MTVAQEPTLRAAADTHREPFGWKVPPELEKSLARDYKKFGKPFLLGKRGDAGVYPGEAHWLIPKGFENRGWLDKHLGPLIGTTDLFPLVTEKGNVFFHAGKIGDIIAALPVIRQLGGGRIVIGDHPAAVHQLPMRGEPYESIRPLLEAQPYVTGVEYSDDCSGATHNLATFREQPRERLESLAQWQANHLGVTDLDLSPWLTVGGATHSGNHGKVIMARSLRYHNFCFPWAEIAWKYRSDLLFVGLPEEHKAFCDVVGMAVLYQPTADCLDMARLIAGAKLFVGNQSAPFWIAAGLGVPLIQESWEWDPNSVVPRENAIYTVTGPETRTLIYRL